MGRMSGIASPKCAADATSPTRRSTTSRSRRLRHRLVACLARIDDNRFSRNQIILKATTNSRGVGLPGANGMDGAASSNEAEQGEAEIGGAALPRTQEPGAITLESSPVVASAPHGDRPFILGAKTLKDGGAERPGAPVTAFFRQGEARHENHHGGLSSQWRGSVHGRTPASSMATMESVTVW